MKNKLHTILSDFGNLETPYSENSIASITVRNLDAALQRCIGSGCRILQDAISIQGHRFALIQDPDGQTVMVSAEPSDPCIEVIGAKTNNLKNIDVLIPLNKYTVLTGVSGSGKSSLAFDTLYADARRRFLESSDSPSFLNSAQPSPDVDFIHGLPPALPVRQSVTMSNPRSTVGTLAEISTLLRVLYAAEGMPRCPFSGEEIRTCSTQNLAEHFLTLEAGTEVEIRIPVYSGDTELQWTEKLQSSFIVGETKVSDIVSVLRQAFDAGGGFLCPLLPQASSGTESFYASLGGSSRHTVAERLDPGAFSFNTDSGACTNCLGLGNLWLADPDLVVVDPDDSLDGRPFAGAAFPCTKLNMSILQGLATAYRFNMSCPYIDLPDFVRDLLLSGTDSHLHRVDGHYYGLGYTFEGVLESVNKRHAKLVAASGKEKHLKNIRKLMKKHTCPHCGGRKLKPQRGYITVTNFDFHSVQSLPLAKFKEFLDRLESNNRILVEKLKLRTASLMDLGLGYLSLNQPAPSLSGGEAQRIRLSAHIAAGLVNMLYVLDEPSIGLHPKDKNVVIDAVDHLCRKGNTVLVIDHDEQVIRSADHLIELGPRAGQNGGELVACGTLTDLAACPASKTGAYLSGGLEIPLPAERRKVTEKRIRIQGARENNLRNIDVTIPLDMFVCVTGPSGSGKTSLIHHTLGRALKTRNTSQSRGPWDSISGCDHLDGIVTIDQSPIGRSSRSNPATYCGFYEPIRSVFRSAASSQGLRGFYPSWFSFNTRDGQCRTCKGAGVIRTSLSFLVDTETQCPDCEGTRFKPEILKVRHNGMTIVDVLDMTIEQGVGHFEDIPVIHRKLSFLQKLGLGYLKIGHPASDMSGGEAQRVKLTNELSKKKTGRKILYILDEPTTGLHLADIDPLIKALDMLIEQGHSVIAIEHHLDIMKSADYLIDLGPGGGPEGGEIMAAGTPEQVMECPDSLTGASLKAHLNRTVSTQNSQGQEYDM